MAQVTEGLKELMRPSPPPQPCLHICPAALLPMVKESKAVQSYSPDPQLPLRRGQEADGLSLQPPHGAGQKQLSGRPWTDWVEKEQGE